MKIAVAQINTVTGDFDGNTSKIVDRIEWARLNKADLVVFPEMAITGYPPKDLLENPDFITNNIKGLEKVAEATDSAIAAIVGYVSENEATTGKGLFNSAAFLHEGKIKYIQNKILLPTYDVFDEVRYFEPGTEHHIVELKGRKFGITICEDIWASAELGGRKLYTVDPVDMLAKKGAEFIVNISASPYVIEKRKLREALLGNVAQKYGLPIIYTNLVGGNDELIFDGCSLVVERDGRVVREGGAFVEDSFIVDIDHLPKIPKKHFLSEAEEVYKALVLGVRDYINKCGFRRVVVGLSGGIDSAVVVCLAADAIGAENVMGISMPTRFSAKESVASARELAKRLGITFNIVDIDKIYSKYLKTLKPQFKAKAQDTTEENIQARIRGNILMAFSNKYGAMVLSTGNKSEMAVGYCTLYGDLAGGIAVISDVPKTMVYKLAGYINRDREIIPSFIISRPPTAELRHNQKDQDELPPYEILDPILKAYIEEHQSVSSIIDLGYESLVVEDVVKKVKRSEYKRRQAPPGFKVTSRAFGWGRWYPIACKC